MIPFQKTYYNSSLQEAIMAWRNADSIFAVDSSHFNGCLHKLLLPPIGPRGPIIELNLTELWLNDFLLFNSLRLYRRELQFHNLSLFKAYGMMTMMMPRLLDEIWYLQYTTRPSSDNFTLLFN